MKKTKLVLAITAVCMLLTACNNPLDLLKKEEKPVEYALTPVPSDQLSENMFYVKNGDQFFPVRMGQTNIPEDDLIAKEANPSRIISFTKDDVMIPTLYKDDSLVYYTTASVPSFTWERMKDYGYTIGMYNLKEAESGKVQFVVGESKTDHNSAAFAGLANIDIGNSVVVLDKVGGQSLSADRLSDCGSIDGLKADEMANIDLYIGTQHYTIESTVDTHVLASMELYQTNEYNLLPEGYASVKIPDYFLSGYYFINGVGVVRYVDNNRSEGIPNVDFSVPYYYYDENTNKQYTLEEWNKLKGELGEDEEKAPDYSFDYDIDTTIKTFSLSLKYDLFEDENVNDILYTAPSATITSPLGEVKDFQSTVQDGKQVLTITVDGVVSGTWNVKVYDLGERKFDLASSIESGNADSFIHSGNNEGKMTIHCDGVSGYATANVKWENATRAATVQIKSPSGVVINDVDNRDRLIVDGYGEKAFLLDGAEAGEWELSIKGEDLGRCWFSINRQDDTVVNTPPAEPADASVPETEPAETEAAAETVAETEAVTQ